MRVKELKRCLSLQAQVFSGLDKSKADKLTLEPILSCFHSLDESQRHLPYPGLFSQLDESKRAKKTFELPIHKSKVKEIKRCLSSPCSKSFQTWMRVRRLKNQHLTYPRLLHGLDESQIALALSQSCSHRTKQPNRQDSRRYKK
jgi:hypothetical protein